jgi:calmodulin-binding transcription activator
MNENKNLMFSFSLLLEDGEPIKLPENLETLPKADHFPSHRHRWNTNEVIIAMLVSMLRENYYSFKNI